MGSKKRSKRKHHVSAIRQLAVTRDSRSFLAGEFESRVHVFQFDRKEELRCFDTVLDFGATRLALSEKEKVCIAGSYYSPGLRAYSIQTGAILWKRPDLRNVQFIGILPDHRVGVEIDRKPFQILSVETGKTIETIRGGRELIASPFGPVQFLEKHVPELQSLSGERIAKIPRETFAILASAFTPSLLVISESGGSVRAFSSKTGEPKWRFIPKAKTHVLELGYNEATNQVLGVLWPYYDGGIQSLLVFDSESGKVVSEFKIGEHETHRFCKRGANLLTSGGQLFDTSTGRVEMEYQFPKIEE